MLVVVASLEEPLIMITVVEGDELKVNDNLRRIWILDLNSDSNSNSNSDSNSNSNPRFELVY